MRLAVLTLRGSMHGLRLLNALHRHGTRVDIAIVLEDTLARKWRLLRSAARRVGWLDAALLGMARLRADAEDAKRSDWRGAPLIRAYDALAHAVSTAVSLHDASVSTALANAQVDLLLLGHCGIVPRSVLAIPRIATLNAHPGLLPGYRGLDCHAWAIYRKDFDGVGSTLHCVDPGIDTGDIVKRHPHRWTGDETLRLLQARLYDDCIDLLVEGVGDIEAGRRTRARQTAGSSYHVMPRRYLPVVERQLNEFLDERAPSVAAATLLAQQ